MENFVPKRLRSFLFRASRILKPANEYHAAGYEQYSENSLPAYALNLDAEQAIVIDE